MKKEKLKTNVLPMFHEGESEESSKDEDETFTERFGDQPIYQEEFAVEVDEDYFK